MGIAAASATGCDQRMRIGTALPSIHALLGQTSLRSSPHFLRTAEIATLMLVPESFATVAKTLAVSALPISATAFGVLSVFPIASMNACSVLLRSVTAEALAAG